MSPLWFNEPEDIELVLADLQSEFSSFPEAVASARVASHTMTVKILQAVYGKLAVGVSKDEWRVFFATIFGKTVRLVNFEAKRSQFVSMLLTKHKNYGTQSLIRWREVGIASRIDQKIARLDNLQTIGQRGTDDETIEDTILDILGYCVLGMYIANHSARSEL